MSLWRWIWLCTYSTSLTRAAGCTLHRRPARWRRSISRTPAQRGSCERRLGVPGCWGGWSLPSHRRAPTQKRECRKRVRVRVWPHRFEDATVVFVEKIILSTPLILSWRRRNVAAAHTQTHLGLIKLPKTTYLAMYEKVSCLHRVLLLKGVSTSQFLNRHHIVCFFLKCSSGTTSCVASAG